MISADENALICDLAETYGIFDYRALPVALLATLCVGLRDNSRIKMRLAGAKATRSEVMLAAIVDRLSLLLWCKTEDGRNGVNRPASMAALLLGDSLQREEPDVVAFTTPEDYLAAWARITGGEI